MKAIAKFEKVSFDQFKDDYCKINCIDNPNVDWLLDVYKSIQLPKRATKGSAGYDFFLPYSLYIQAGDSVKFPTGIRCRMEEGWVLLLLPRSSLGLKYRFQLDNTCGVIDQDFYNSDNEGHIMAKFTNDSRENKTLRIERGKAYMQGIFVKFGITVDDDTTAVRNGGIGSTDKN